MRRFDVLQDEGDPAHVVLSEVYVDQAAADAHKQTAHYARWRDAVAGMMARSRAELRTRFSAVFPGEERLVTRVRPRAAAEGDVRARPRGRARGAGAHARAAGAAVHGQRPVAAPRACWATSSRSPSCRVTREPTVDDARAATEQARAAGADAVVAIGGGSVMDLGKAVAVLLGNGTDPLDHLEIVGKGVPIERPSVPFVAVPTTAGTGAEATANAVLRSPRARAQGQHPQPAHAAGGRARRPAAHPRLPARRHREQRARRADPVPGALRLAQGQPGDRRRRRRGAAARRAVAAPRLRAGDDREAREDMALCSLFGGVALANAKLGAVHGLAGVVGGHGRRPARRRLRRAARAGGRGERPRAARARAGVARRWTATPASPGC